MKNDFIRLYSAPVLIALTAWLPVSRAAMPPPPTALSLNARMARETPDMIHPEITVLLGRLVSSGNSSQEAFFDLRNVPPAYRDLDRIRYWSGEQIDLWSDYLIRHGIELVPSVNMYEPVADQVAGWQRFAAKGCPSGICFLAVSSICANGSRETPVTACWVRYASTTAWMTGSPQVWTCAITSPCWMNTCLRSKPLSLKHAYILSLALSRMTDCFSDIAGSGATRWWRTPGAILNWWMVSATISM